MSDNGCSSPMATPARPKTSASAARTPEPAARASASSAITPAPSAAFRTPRRKEGACDGTPSTAGAPSCCSSSSSSKSSRSVRKMAGSGRKSIAGDGDISSGEGLRTPACRGGSCAICLSPLKNSSAARGGVYTVQLCRHNFHKACLTENRRVGNTGCPYCRGELESGLTPEATAAEREAKALAERQQDQREAIRNAAGRARMALARSLRVHQEILAREAAAAAATAEAAVAEESGEFRPIQSH